MEYSVLLSHHHKAALIHLQCTTLYKFFID